MRALGAPPAAFRCGPSEGRRAVCLPRVGGGKAGVIEAINSAVLEAEIDPVIRQILGETRASSVAEVEAFQPFPSELDMLVTGRLR